MKLTIESWRGLVANHLRRAWESQWSETTDREMDYAGERLVEDGWTVSRATWCVRQVVRVSYSPKGIMAAMDKVDRGERDRDGNLTGGWLQSKEHLAENQAARDERQRRDCYAECTDFPDRAKCQRGKSYCGGCAGVKARKPWDATTGQRFKRVGDVAREQVERLAGGA